jgi:sRNA-binding regulator protein Hfq
MRRYEPGNTAPPAHGNVSHDRRPDPQERRSEDVVQGHRRLIRPNLSELKDRLGPRVPRRKQVPPEQTNAEAFYYLKQMNSRTPMVVVLKDGEELRGIIEWYDRVCIKVNRVGSPNVMVMKDCIKYMYKEEEARGVKDASSDSD